MIGLAQLTKSIRDMKFDTIYAKEELPTYAEILEMYNKEYYVSRALDKDNKRWQELDPYWNIPRYKVLLATCANEFNKILYNPTDSTVMDSVVEFFKYAHGLEYDIDVLWEFNGNHKFEPITVTSDVIKSWHPHFVIENALDDNIDSKYRCTFDDNNNHPPIYTIRLPNGELSPFITSNVRRIVVNDIPDKIEMAFVWSETAKGYAHYPVINMNGYIDNFWDCTHPNFQKLLKHFIVPIQKIIDSAVDSSENVRDCKSNT